MRREINVHCDNDNAGSQPTARALICRGSRRPIRASVAANTAFGGKTCNTGLLNPDVYDQYVCNIHPAHTVHRLIAKTIEHALHTAD